MSKQTETRYAILQSGISVAESVEALDSMLGIFANSPEEAEGYSLQNGQDPKTGTYLKITFETLENA